MMDREEKLRRIRAMLERVAPELDADQEASVLAPGMATLQGFGESVPGPAPLGAPDLRSGLAKLAAGRTADISRPEELGLEAIVLPKYRPVVFVRGGGYDALTAPWTHLGTAEVKARIGRLLPSIGRIELPTMPWYPYGGTGFVVGSDLLMTNRHVARLFTEGVGRRALVYREGDAAVDFVREQSTATSTPLVVTEVVMVHPYWDMALLRVEGLAPAHAPLRLSTRTPDELRDRDVVVVGYPARDDRNDLALQDQIFARTYGVKRLQPGKLRERGAIASYGGVVQALTHDASTLGGNSGSAVIDVASGEVVGLHFAGQYLIANYAVPTWELARDRRVAALGLAFVGAVDATSAWDPAWRAVEPEERPTGASSAVAASSPAAPISGGVTFTVPLQITVTLGAGQVVGAAVATPKVVARGDATEGSRLQVPIIHDGLEERAGFDRHFLDVQGGVPMPVLTARGKKSLARLDDDDVEIRYHKFSVWLHRGRRLALFTAANVDWRTSVRRVDGKKPTRAQLTGLPDSVSEQWVTDWRVRPEDQLPDVFYTLDGAAFDKGHIVRRDDVAWGDDFNDIQKANGDTYHVTNCSPQVLGFNRSMNGVDNWGDLEVLVQSQTKRERAVVFAGPVLDRDDPLFDGVDDRGPIRVRIPRRFWKVIVVAGDAGPEAYGFVLEQDLSTVPTVEELAVPARWRPHMRPIADIEKLLFGLAKLNGLEAYDQYDTVQGHEVARRVRRGEDDR